MNDCGCHHEDDGGCPYCRLDLAVEGLAEIANLSPDEAKEHAARIARKALAKATDEVGEAD